MNLKNLYKYKKQIYIISIIFLIIIVFGSIYLVKASNIPEETNKQNENILIEKPKDKKEETKDKEENYVLIDIKGAVINPGVYQLKEGCSVIDAINMAGGLKENANTNLINLSKKLTDEMVIIIYTNEQIEEYLKEEVITEFVYIEIPCECPDNINNACIDIKEEQEDIKNEENKKLISINKATKEELMTLTGIGESKANNIIEYRNKNGLFKNVEEIKNVSGIGDSAFEKIKDNITI